MSCSFHLRTLQLSGYFDAESNSEEYNDFSMINDQVRKIYICVSFIRFNDVVIAYTYLMTYSKL